MLKAVIKFSFFIGSGLVISAVYGMGLTQGEGVSKSNVTGGSGTYYAAGAQKEGKHKYDQVEVILEDKKKIILEVVNCLSCSASTYLYQGELSQAITKPVYKMGDMGRFLIEQEKGILWVASAQLGKELWQTHNSYNVLGQDKEAIRLISQETVAQDQVETSLKAYAVKAKKALDALNALNESDISVGLLSTEMNELPEKGMENDELEKSALSAAQDWANKHGWKEQLQYVYITSHGWSFIRDYITGMKTGRRIEAVITMKRDDDLCSYQEAIFEQDFNGSDFQETVMATVVHGYSKLDCEKI